MLAKPGPITLLRGALPKVKAAGSAKQPVLNHCSWVPAPPSFGSHV
jgi:hypothetical protein